eukprot:m.172616 g.172616  ORF g.172616 m.172616 type:complete len:312 (-) comp13561_c0_seq1:333-1268(-)
MMFWVAKLKRRKSITVLVGTRAIPPNILLLVAIKVVRVPCMLDLGAVRGRDLLVGHGFPISGCHFKVLHLFDVAHATVHGSESLGQVNLKQATNELLFLGGKVTRVLKITSRNALKHLKLAACLKWRFATSHFVNENTHGPPVHSVVVTLVHDDFRRKVLGCTTHCPRFVFHPFGKPEIRKPNVTLVVNQHVFRLEITENNVEIVQVFKGQDRLSGKEFRLFCSEPPTLLFLNVCEHFTPIDKLEHKVETLGVLEVIIQAHDEIVLAAKQNVLFIESVFNLFCLDNAILPNDFDCLKVLTVLALSQQDSAK